MLDGLILLENRNIQAAFLEEFARFTGTFITRMQQQQIPSNLLNRLLQKLLTDSKKIFFSKSATHKNGPKIKNRSITPSIMVLNADFDTFAAIYATCLHINGVIAPRDQIKSNDDYSFEDYSSILYIIMAFSLFNIAVIEKARKATTPQFPDALQSSLDYFALIEDRALVFEQSPFISQAMQLFSQKYLANCKEIYDRNRITPHEFRQFISSHDKDKKRVVVYEPNSAITTVHLASLVKVCEVFTECVFHPNQKFLRYFFLNNEFGPIDVLSACFNESKCRFEVVYVSFDQSDLMYRSLNAISGYVKKAFHDVPIQFSASHLPFLNNQQHHIEYAYVIGKILQKTSLEDWLYNTSIIPQPTFQTPACMQKISHARLIGVVWIHPACFGDKIKLLASTEKQEQFFIEVYGQKDGPLKLDFLRHKYDICPSGYFEAMPQHYRDYVFHKIRTSLHGKDDQPCLVEGVIRTNERHPTSLDELENISKSMSELRLENQKKAPRQPKNRAPAKSEIPPSQDKPNVSTPIESTTSEDIEMDEHDVCLPFQLYTEAPDWNDSVVRALRCSAGGSTTLETFELLLKYFETLPDNVQSQYLQEKDDNGMTLTAYALSRRHERRARRIELIEATLSERQQCKQKQG